MNNYQIYDEVGKGRFSNVYKGRRKKTIEYYAISSVDKSQRQRVLANVKFLRSAHHQRIIKFHNWYETNNHLWIITELCTGGDMRQVLSLDSRLSVAAVRMFGGDIAEGLMYIHSRGAVYGDLKPSNILMDSTMSMRFYDFGLTRDFSAVHKEGAVGTPLYMSPELFTRDGVPSMASDLWAFGCLLHEMITGKPPFEGADLTALITNIMAVPYRRHEGTPDVLNDLLESLLVKNPLKRATWVDVVASDFWQGRLQLPTAPFPPQPVFDSMKQQRAGSGWPMPAAEVRRHVEWAVDAAKRNYTMSQFTSEVGAPKSPGVADEIDLRDHSAPSETAVGDSANGGMTSSSGQGTERRVSAGSGARAVNATHSNFLRNKERLRGDGGTLVKDNNINILQVPTIDGGLENLHLDDLLVHPSDAHIRPLVMNSRIERFVEQKYNPDALGFEAPSRSDLKTFNEQQQAQFITTIYRTLSSSSLGFEEKLNVLFYFEIVCTDASIANFIVNSSVMMLCLKMASQRKAPSSYRATAASIMGILVRHATYIHTDLAKANILSSILKVYSEEDSPRVKRKLAACLGEFLIYIAVQQERDRAAWGIDPAAIFVMYVNILSDADDVLKHYAVKTIENLASVADKGVALDVFAKPETVMALLAIYALPPASTRSEHMRSSAVCAALKLAMLREEFMPLVLESNYLKIGSYGEVLTATVAPKAAQSLLTFLNMVVLKGLVGVQNPVVALWGKEATSSFAASCLTQEKAEMVLKIVSSVAESVIGGLCEGSEHASVAMKGKALLLLILLGCMDEQLLARLCSSRHVAYIDAVVRDKDSYVQRCAACLACYLGVFFEAQLAEIARGASSSTTLTALNALYNIMSARNIGTMVELGDGVFKSLGTCLEKALSSPRYAAYEPEFNKLVELLAQNCDRTLRHRRAVASELFPPYLRMISGSDSERRFSALRILSAFVAPLGDDTGLTKEDNIVEGETLDHLMQKVAASLPELLKESEPIPIHAIRLLTACCERRPKAFATLATVEVTGELVRYMMRSRQTDLSVPLQLLLLALQTERAADLMDYLVAQEFITAVLFKTLSMAVAKDLDHLLDPCCEIAAFFLKQAVQNMGSRMAQQCIQLLTLPGGLETLWLPVCCSQMRTAAEKAATCVFYFVRMSSEAQQSLMSAAGIKCVREIISDTRGNPAAVLHILRALRYSCERSRKREVQKLSQWLLAALEAIAREGASNQELSSEASAIIELIRG
ncbi:protein kinase [Trypanosoma grayi]|uniref:protein kinase n=1 Tax=Trypanosoma grayi TaxID=71804 RepID=UPI0004F47513|nr:protein kinase [Trypanosoma grayi]KEG12095.1 protein kinase [Trypanosoma grayi]